MRGSAGLDYPMANLFLSRCKLRPGSPLMPCRTVVPGIPGLVVMPTGAKTKSKRSGGTCCSPPRRKNAARTAPEKHSRSPSYKNAARVEVLRLRSVASLPHSAQDDIKKVALTAGLKPCLSKLTATRFILTALHAGPAAARRRSNCQTSLQSGASKLVRIQVRRRMSVSAATITVRRFCCRTSHNDQVETWISD